MAQGRYFAVAHEAAPTQKVLLEAQYEDSLTMLVKTQEAVQALREEGYLTANIDSVVTTDDKVYLHAYVGRQYRYGDIRFDKAERTLIQAAGLRRYEWGKKKISEQQVGNYMRTVGSYLENNGYPFVSVGLDSIAISDGKVDAKVAVERGPLILWDSLKIIGELDVSTSYLRQYLNVPEGRPYSRKTYEAIGRRLRDLPFVQLREDPKLQFYDGKAELYLIADKKKSSRFDFLIGVLPSTSGGERRFTITGEFTGELYNRLGYGEYIYASIERLREDVQEADLKVNYPYIAGLPIGANTSLRVYRRSGDFIEVVADLGLSYQISGSQQLLFGWNLKSSRLIDIDSSAILRSGRLPRDLDITYQGGKLGYEYQNVDYRWNPAKGLVAQLSATVGQKRILPNRSIQDIKSETIDFANSYDSLQLSTLQIETTADVAYYIPIARQLTVKTALRVGMLYNTQQVFENEYYRIGGNRLLRGFDEQTVLAQAYAISTTELRLLLDRNSFLTLPFVDFGYTQVLIDGLPTWDRVFGVGFGINFQTPAGMFNVSFATGSRLANPLNFNDTKVHFGYVSLF